MTISAKHIIEAAQWEVIYQSDGHVAIVHPATGRIYETVVYEHEMKMYGWQEDKNPQPYVELLACQKIVALLSLKEKHR